MQKSMTVYIRALSKRNEGDDKEKPLAVGYLGGTMVHLGENFENDSEFGRCLVGEFSTFVYLPFNDMSRCFFFFFFFFFLSCVVISWLAN